MAIWLHKLVLTQHFYKVCYTMLAPSPPSSIAPSSMGAPFVRVMVKSKVQWSVGLGNLFVVSFYWIAIVKHNLSPL